MSHKIYRVFSINQAFYFTVTWSRYGLLNYRVIKVFFSACCEISKYATLLTEVDNVCNRKEHFNKYYEKNSTKIIANKHEIYKFVNTTLSD